MTDMIDAAPLGAAQLTSADQALIAELCTLTRKLDRQGALAALGDLLPADILDHPEEQRIACLTAARDTCRTHIGKLRRVRHRRRLMAVLLPFALGMAGTPYVMHLLA